MKPPNAIKTQLIDFCCQNTGPIPKTVRLHTRAKTITPKIEVNVISKPFNDGLTKSQREKQIIDYLKNKLTKQSIKIIEINANIVPKQSCTSVDNKSIEYKNDNNSLESQHIIQNSNIGKINAHNNTQPRGQSLKKMPKIKNANDIPNADTLSFPFTTFYKHKKWENKRLEYINQKKENERKEKLQTMIKLGMHLGKKRLSLPCEPQCIPQRSVDYLGGLLETLHKKQIATPIPRQKTIQYKESKNSIKRNIETANKVLLPNKGKKAKKKKKVTSRNECAPRKLFTLNPVKQRSKSKIRIISMMPILDDIKDGDICPWN